MFAQENIEGLEVAAANQKVWLYAEDGKTLVTSATTNANGWVDFGLQPERFALGYIVGNQYVYRTISENSGELKVISAFDETVQDETCPVSKTVQIANIQGEAFEAHTNHPEWVTTLGEDGKTLTICAARAPVDGKFDLWVTSSAGYQQWQDVSWQTAASFSFSPKAPTLTNWSLKPGTSSLLVSTVLITNAKDLTIYSRTTFFDDATSSLDVPNLSGSNYNLVFFGQDQAANSYKIAVPFTSLNALPSIELPAASIEQLKWKATDQTVSWSNSSSSLVDFFELSVQLDNNVSLVTVLDKGQSSFTVPQIPQVLGRSPGDNSTIVLSSVDFKDYSDLNGWLQATQSPLVTLQEFIDKLHTAEKSATRITHSK
jgi:hypothetical protein